MVGMVDGSASLRSAQTQHEARLHLGLGEGLPEQGQRESELEGRAALEEMPLTCEPSRTMQPFTSLGRITPSRVESWREPTTFAQVPRNQPGVSEGSVSTS